MAPHIESSYIKYYEFTCNILYMWSIRTVQITLTWADQVVVLFTQFECPMDRAFEYYPVNDYGDGQERGR